MATRPACSGELNPISYLYLSMHQIKMVQCSKLTNISTTDEIIHYKITHLDTLSSISLYVQYTNTFINNKSIMAASVQIMYKYTYSTHASPFWGTKYIFVVPISPHLIQILNNLTFMEYWFPHYGFQDYSIHRVPLAEATHPISFLSYQFIILSFSDS